MCGWSNSWELPLGSDALGNPIEIPSLLGGVVDGAQGCTLDLYFGAWIKPLVNFRMTVGEGKTASPIVVGGWQVTPVASRWKRQEEKTVIDAVRVFVERH